MKSKNMSVTEYAGIRGISRQAVLNAIKEGYRMKGVVSFVKVGNGWVLKVEKDYNG